MTPYLWNLLIGLDQLANALLAPALNAVLRPTAARFGHPDETLSSVLGKNEYNRENRIKNKAKVTHAE